MSALDPHFPPQLLLVQAPLRAASSVLFCTSPTPTTAVAQILLQIFLNFADDATLVSCLSETVPHATYQSQVDEFAKWCSDHFLELNCKKTKEMVSGTRKNVCNVTFLNGTPVGQVEIFKYLGLTLDSGFTSREHVTVTQKRAQQPIARAWVSPLLGVDPKLLLLLYRSIVEPVLMYCGMTYFAGLSVSDSNRLLRVMNTAAKIIGQRTPSLSETAQTATIRKAQAIAVDPLHPLIKEYQLLPSGKRFRSVKCKKMKFNNSFVPRSVRLLNAQ